MSYTKRVVEHYLWIRFIVSFFTFFSVFLTVLLPLTLFPLFTTLPSFFSLMFYFELSQAQEQILTTICWWPVISVVLNSNKELFQMVTVEGEMRERQNRYAVPEGEEITWETVFLRPREDIFSLSVSRNNHVREEIVSKGHHCAAGQKRNWHNGLLQHRLISYFLTFAVCRNN